MHRGDSFGSRLEDFTSAFHICNDRGRRRSEETEKETNTVRESERERTEKVDEAEEGDLNPGRSDRERRRRTRKVGGRREEERGGGWKKRSERQGPGVRAPPRRVGPTPTILASTYRLSSRTRGTYI